MERQNEQHACVCSSLFSDYGCYVTSYLVQMNNDNYIQRNKQMVERILRENEQQNEIRKTMQDIKTEVNNRIKILRKK